MLGGAKKKPEAIASGFLFAFYPCLTCHQLPLSATRGKGQIACNLQVSVSERVVLVQCPLKKCRHFFEGSQIGATILYPNTKVLVNQGLFVFLGVKYTPLSPLHLFPDLLDLNLRLLLLNGLDFYDIIYLTGGI